MSVDICPSDTVSLHTDTPDNLTQFRLSIPTPTIFTWARAEVLPLTIVPRRLRHRSSVAKATFQVSGKSWLGHQRSWPGPGCDIALNVTIASYSPRCRARLSCSPTPATERKPLWVSSRASHHAHPPCCQRLPPEGGWASRLWASSLGNNCRG